ncbi:MAG: hypothetical protein K2O38_03300 [Muribaculaceae bacterium]|nr:hypothetical protein [Muribaculaceae bacterium]
MKQIVLVLSVFVVVVVAQAKSLEPERIDSARSAVWSEWVAAQPQTLPSPRLLAEGGGASWVIPDSLEPHAVMDYFFGLKGEAERYPLFIYLHGSGPRDLEWGAGFQLAGMFDDAPSVYFIPRIPNEGEYYRWYQRGKQWVWGRLLRAFLASEWADPDRIYLIGISEGGYGSQRLASFYADYLAAAGPMAGGELLENAPPENLRNIAFSLRTGADDEMFCRNLLTGYLAAELDSLSAANEGDYRHWVDVIPGYGHAIDYRPTAPWLRGFERRHSPRRLTWENFPMDGRYRSGFGNLQVIRRSNHDESTRTVYDFEVEDNQIRLDARLVSYECVERDSRWGMPIKFAKHYVPVDSGAVRIFLDETMVDFSCPVTLTVNGREQFSGMVFPTVEDLHDSCAEFGDPRRLFPASLTAIF